MKKLIPVSTPESIANTADVLRMAVETRGFEFIMVNSLKETMRRNGIDLCHEFQTFSIYLPRQVGKVLDSTSTILPWLISLCREDGKTVLSTVKPTGFPLNDAQQQQLVADEIEEMMTGIIEEVCNRKPPFPQPEASNEDEK